MLALTVRKREIYGRVLYYPVCTRSIDIASLLGSKTFTEYQKSALEAIGFDITVTH